MIEALKGLIVKDGLIYMVDSDHLNGLDDIAPEDVSISVIDDGIAIIVKNEVIIRVPENLLDYIIDNRNIILYTFGADYIEVPVVTIELLRDALVEARSIYRYSKNKILSIPENQNGVSSTIAEFQ